MKIHEVPKGAWFTTSDSCKRVMISDTEYIRYDNLGEMRFHRTDLRNDNSLYLIPSPKEDGFNKLYERLK